MKTLYKSICLLFVQSLFQPAFAQLPELDWYKTFSPAEPGARVIPGGIQTSPDGNFVMYGQLTGAMDVDPGPGTSVLNPADGHAFFAKYDPQGNLLWARTLPMSIHAWNLNPETGWIVYNARFTGSHDFDPGAGSHILNGMAGSMALVRLDAGGNFKGATDIMLPLWVNDLAIDKQGQVILAGSFSDSTDFDPSGSTTTLTSAGGSDGFVAVYDNSLNFRQAFAIGGIYDDGIGSIGLTADGFSICGRFAKLANFDPAGGSQTLSTGSGSGFVASYTLDAAGIGLKTAFTMGSSVEKITTDPGSNQLTVFGSIGDDMDADPGPGVSMLYAVGNKDQFVSHTKADGSFGFGKVFSVGTSRPTANTVASRQGGLFYAGSLNKAVDVNAGQPNGTITPIGSTDLFVCKFQDDGVLRYGFSIGAPGATTTAELAVSSKGAILLAGMTSGTLDLDPGTGIAPINPNAENLTFLARYKDENTLGIAPLPTAGTVSIHCSGRTAIVDFSDCKTVNASISVSDLSGRSILQTTHKTADMRRIGLGDIAPGFYLITVQNGPTRMTKKIPVQ